MISLDLPKSAEIVSSVCRFYIILHPLINLHPSYSYYLSIFVPFCLFSFNKSFGFFHILHKCVN